MEINSFNIVALVGVTVLHSSIWPQRLLGIINKSRVWQTSIKTLHSRLGEEAWCQALTNGQCIFIYPGLSIISLYFNQFSQDNSWLTWHIYQPSLWSCSSWVDDNVGHGLSLDKVKILTGANKKFEIGMKETIYI